MGRPATRTRSERCSGTIGSVDDATISGESLGSHDAYQPKADELGLDRIVRREEPAGSSPLSRDIVAWASPQIVITCARSRASGRIRGPTDAR